MGNPGRWVGALAWISVGLLVGLGVYTFQKAGGLSYLSDDPRACLNCHVMTQHYQAWSQGSHSRGAACNDCHLPHSFPEKWLAKVENGVNHSVKFVLRTYQKPFQIRSVNLDRVVANCIRCHGEQISRMPDHPVKPDEGIRCTDCHVSVGHALPE